MSFANRVQKCCQGTIEIVKTEREGSTFESGRNTGAIEHRPSLHSSVHR